MHLNVSFEYLQSVHVAMWHVEKQHTMQFLYLAYAYLFGSFATLPRLWSFLFFSVIFLAELSALVSPCPYLYLYP